jgi:hypothetical protein
MFALSGCSGLLEMNAGYQRSLSRDDGKHGVGLNVSSGLGAREGGFGAHARAKFGETINQVGVGAHGYVTSGGEFRDLPFQFDSAVYARFGADLLQVGAAEGHGSVGLMCPFFDLGVIIPNPGLSLSASAQYDWRLSSARNDF